MARKDSNASPTISNAEWEVMKTLWEGGPLAARDVYAVLPEGHGWAYKTVKTLLARLVAKGAVEYKQIGNSYLYHAACSREQVTRKEVTGFIDRVFQGSIFPILARFIEERDLSDEEIANLRRMLEKKENKSESREKRKKS